MSTSDCDILNQFCNTSNKLKKRFLRKPNVTEACESFISLGQNCETSEQPSFAGLCWIAAARCEGSLGNIPGETSCLIRSARQFLNAEEYDYRLGCPGPAGEHLQAAISSYAHASSKYSENSPIKVGLNLELVDFLKRIERPEYVEQYLTNALQLSEGTVDTKIYCLELLATNFINSGNYTAALNTLTELANFVASLSNNRVRSEILLNCEVTRVFLLLILRPSPQMISPNLAKLLEKYTWGDKSDKSLKACGMSERMFLLLQSLVTVCQSSDVSTLGSLEAEFWQLLTNEQRGVLRVLVQTYT